MTATHCPSCKSPSPDRHPATGFEGEVSYFCPDLWHDSDPWHLARRSPDVQRLIDESRERAAAQPAPSEPGDSDASGGQARPGPDDLAALRALCEEIWDAWPSEVVLALLDRTAAVPAAVQADAALIRPFRIFLEAFEDSGGIERLSDEEWLRLRPRLTKIIRELVAALPGTASE